MSAVHVRSHWIRHVFAELWIDELNFWLDMSDVPKQNDEESVAQDSLSLTLSTYSNVPSVVLFALNSLCIQNTIISHALHIASDMPSTDPDTLSIPALRWSMQKKNCMYETICTRTKWKALLEI